MMSEISEENGIAVQDPRLETRRQYVTFYLEDHFLGVEVDTVQEVFKAKHMTAVPLAPETISGLINLRGHIIMTIDLRKRLGFNPRLPEEKPMSIVVRTSEGLVNMLVDRIGDVIHVLPELFESPPSTLDPQISKTLEGVYKLEDKLLLVLVTEKITHVV